MKVILKKFVKDLGREGDIIEVSDGYAVNALFPKGLAQQATADIVNKHKMAQKSAQLKAEKEKEHTLLKLEKLKDKEIIFEEKLNPKGSLYHALGVKEIIKKIKEDYEVDIQKNLFTEKYSFRDAGSHQVEIESYGKKVSISLVIKEK